MVKYKQEKQEAGSNYPDLITQYHSDHWRLNSCALKQTGPVFIDRPRTGRFNSRRNLLDQRNDLARVFDVLEFYLSTDVGAGPVRSWEKRIRGSFTIAHTA